MRVGARSASPCADQTVELFPALPTESSGVDCDAGLLSEKLDAYGVVVMDLHAGENGLQVPNVIFKVGQNVRIRRGAEEELRILSGLSGGLCRSRGYQGRCGGRGTGPRGVMRSRG